MVDKETLKITGKAILFASMQFAIGSVEMSSKFSVINFCESQEILQRAADALSDYIIIAIVWTIGTSLVFYANYGWYGFFINVVANLVIMAWIVFSYFRSFGLVCKRRKFNFPKLFHTYLSGQKEESKTKEDKIEEEK